MSLNQIKTRIGKRPLMILGIALALVALTAVAVIAGEFILSPANDVKIVNDAVFIAFNPADATGTGLFNAFLRISGNTAIVQGYTTDNKKTQFDEDAAWTKSIPLSAIPYALRNGVLYREFQLDINQNTPGDNRFISLDEVQIWLGGPEVKEITGFVRETVPTAFGTFPGYSLQEVFNLDKNENNWIKLDYTLNAGSGKRDAKMLVPDALFGDYGAACQFMGTGCEKYVVFYSLFGENWANNDGFEEWGVAVYNTVSGFKWHDLNADGTWQQPGEPGLKDWQICAQPLVNGAPQGDPICSLTLIDGRYTLPLADGTYRIYEVCPADWYQSFPAPTAGCGTGTYTVTVSKGQALSGRNFGNYKYGIKSGYKWHDVNQDGVWSGELEVGLNNWTIQALDGNGVVVASDVTKNDAQGNPGYYELRLLPGTYKVCEVQKPEYLQTFPKTADGCYALTIASGETHANNNFGNMLARPAIDVSKTCVAAAFVGQEITYSFTVTNIGNVPLSNVTVKDPLIGLDEAIPNLGVNESKTFTKKYTPTTDGPIVNTVTATGKFGNTTVTDTAECTTTVYAPTVRKTAAGAYNELHEWTVVKTVNPTSQNAFAGDTVSYEWTVTVTEKVTDKDFAVTGVIYVVNPAPIAMTVSLADALSDGTVASITACTGGTWTSPNLTVPANTTAECDYTAAPTGKTATKNTATITLFGKTYSAEAPITWVKTEINPTVTLDDDQSPDFPKTISDGGTWKYTENYTCSTNAELYAGDWTYTFGEKNLAQVKAGATVLSESEASTAVNCWMIDVSKTANTTFKRTWQWTIEKRVTPAAWKLFDGDSGTSAYEIVVTKTGYVDSDWAVSGKIKIVNPAPIPAPITAVVDTIPGATDLTLNCPWLGTPIPAGGTVECTYSAKLPNGDPRTNTATVSMPNKSYTATAPVTFGAPTTVVNDTITVKDGAMEWEFTASGSATYNKKFTCAGIEYTDNYGSKEYPNTATIKETGQSSSAKVTVECWKLDVKKDAQTSWKRYWDWTIDKTGDQETLTLMPGEVFLVNYAVTVTAAYKDNDFAVAGVITVTNPAPIAAVINSVADVISPAIAPTLNCGVTFPYTLAGGGTLTCNYASALPDAASRVNTATVVQQNYDYDKNLAATPAGTSTYTATANVVFSATPSDQVDECIDLSDSMYGNLGTVCANQAPKTITYSIEIGPYSLEQCGGGPYEFTNCASFVTNDTKKTGEDCWTVTVTVPCPGCTYTQGYWKNHAGFGPQAMDPGWMKMGDFDGDGVVEGPNEQLFWPGADYTWYQVFTTPPKGGNAWYILAHQFMAAYLNVANGASAPAMVSAALAEAYTLLQNNNPATFKDWKGSAAAKRMIELAYILDQYNNGYLGVPHCK